MKRMKSKMSFVLALSIMLGCFFSLNGIAVYATQNRTANFSRNYTLTGNGAADILNIAKAQIGKTGSNLGYSEAWCANFVSDCAELAGQSSAVPRHANVDGLTTNLLKAGGVKYTNISQAQPGDIVFYDGNDRNGSPNHVEIVGYVSGGKIYSIGGNTSYVNSVYTSKVSTVRYYGNYFLYFIRPNYTSGGTSTPGSIVVDPDIGYPEPTRNLSVQSPYMTGDDVKWVQKALTMLGYSLNTDGIYGSSTKSVVLSFQKNNGLTADGIVGAGTRAKIKELIQANKVKPVDIGTNFYAMICHNGKVLSQINDNVVLSTESGAQNQLWYFERIDGLYYKITNKENFKVLDAAGQGTSNGTNVGTYKSNDTAAQRWCFVKSGDNLIIIPKYSSNIALDLYGGYMDDGTNIQLYERNNTFSQVFIVIEEQKVDIGTDFYAYIANSGMVLEQTNDNVVLAIETGSKNQLWHFEKTDGLYYKITNEENKKCLDAAGQVTSNGTNVGTYANNNTDAQRWYFVKSGGNYNIIPKYCNNITLDITSGSIKNGTNIQLYERNNTFSQEFVVVVPNYIVSYNMNGGNGSIGNQTKTYGQDLTLSSTKPTRIGYEFVGWNTNASATTVQYQSGGKYTANSGATLYAIWKANTYIVSYNMNGGSGSISNQTKTYGQDLTLSSTKPTRIGYDFVGWNTNASATTAQYQSGGKYTANSSVILYAIWKANTYIVSYDMNSGSGSIGNQTKTYGQDITLSTTVPTRTGYTFVGWSTDKNATTAQYQSGDKFTANADTTLYAVWKTDVKPLENNSTVSKTNFNVGEAVTIKGAAAGGNGAYTYEFHYKRSTATAWTKFGSATSATFKPSSAGTFDIKVTAKDSAGNSSVKEFTVTAKAALVNNSTVSKTSFNVGEAVTVKGAAAGGTGTYTYEFYYKRNTATAWTKFGSATAATFKPSSTGTFDIRVYVKDSKGAFAVK
ncbi:MAG: InlB B-repeat-containing protein, partial [Clostridia bacterium]|nr:InlB B-repeat-containing protein [Clostridia bacterium]